MKNYSYASIAKRVISFTIDDISTSFLFIAIFYDNITQLTTPEIMFVFMQENIWVLMLLKVIYHTFFIGFSGMTPGKYIVKIRAVDESSKKELSWAMAFLRAVVRIVGETLFYTTFLFALFESKKQTLHDKISKCIVINVK